MSQEKCTIQAAAKALNMTTKTIYRYLSNGTLSRIREGNRTFILVDEVRKLRSDMSVTEKEGVRTNHSDSDSNTITINLTEYKELIQELGHYKGQLEGQTRNLLENKAVIEGKDRTIADQQATIQAKDKELEQIRAEVERLSLPWYRRIFKWIWMQ